MRPQPMKRVKPTKADKGGNDVGIEPRRVMFGKGNGRSWSRNPGTPSTHQYG